jgi:hypothetical protein
MTPGNLVRAVASAFEAPESEVAQYDRRLLEAGLRTTGGRGSSAPDVQAADVVRLVIATLVRDRHSQTVATVTDWWNLPLVSGEPSRKQKAMMPPRVLAIATANSCTFGAAFTALMDDCINGDMESLLGSPKAWGPKFGLKIIPQHMRAEIGFSDGSDAHVDLAFQRGVDSDSQREFLTIHQTSIRPLIGIAQQMRA